MWNLLVLEMGVKRKLFSTTQGSSVKFHINDGSRFVLIVVVWCRDTNRRTKRSSMTHAKIVDVKQWMQMYNVLHMEVPICNRYMQSSIAHEKKRPHLPTFWLTIKLTT
jgi:hypothetical protein